MSLRFRATLIVSILFTLAAGFYTNPSPPPPVIWRPTIHQSKPITPRNVDIDFALKSPDSPSGEIDWAYVVFQSYRTGNWEIFTAYNDGSGPVNRTNNPAQDYHPSIKKDGTQIAFTSTRDGNPEIYRMNIDGSGQTRLTRQSSEDYSPSWSPDGNKIAFVSERNGNPEIYVMNADGNNQMRLTSNPKGDFAPAWSPDGAQIAWIQYTDDYWGKLAIMSANGSNKVNRTGDLLFPGGTAWSPDGRYIIIDKVNILDGTSELVAIDIINGPFWNYYDPGGSSSSTAIDAWTGAFSPDGNAFMFVRAIWRSDDGGQNYYLDQTWLEKIAPPLYPTTPVRIQGSGTDSHPSWGSRDLLPPRTQVYRLPEFSRAARFLVKWGGFDQGIAGLKDYHIQFRNDDDPNWFSPGSDPFEPITFTSDTSMVWGGNPARRVFFRSRGRDYASNVEEWPPSPDGDTHTTLYGQVLSGHISDLRGISVPNASLNAPAALNDSPTSGKDGSYIAYMPSGAMYSLAPSHGGYGSFSEARLFGKADHVYNQYLPPIQDAVFNGDFENGLDGWQDGGEIDSSRALSYGLTGLSAAQLGPGCNGLCLDEPIDLPDSSMDSYDIAVAQDGTLHLLWTDYTPHGWYTLTYSARTPDGLWLDPAFLYGEGGSSTPKLIMDSSGTLHAVWVTDSGIKYAYKPASGGWSALEYLPSGENPQIAVDNAGNVYVVYYYRETWGFFKYIYRNTSGVWSSPESLTARADYSGIPGICAASDGTVHFIWQERERVFTRSRTPSGALTPAQYLIYLPSSLGYSHQILERPDGTLIAIGKVTNESYYLERPAGEDWQVRGLPKLDGDARMLQSGDGKVHLLNTFENHTYYRFWQQGMGWSEPLPVDVPLSEFGTDSYGNLFIVRGPYEGRLYISSRAPAASSTSLSQQVTIPEDTLHPTLAWQYLFAGLPVDNSYFDVDIDNGVSQTSVYSSMGNSLWQHAWADLSPWAGQTVTVIFKLNQAVGDPLVNVNLDDVSLGAWETPVILGVSPHQLDNWLGATIMITGGNFIQTAAVRLDQIVLVNVHWVNENTLTAEIPPGLTPGYHDIWVINPGGAEAVLPNGLLLGKVAYLPALFR